MRTLEARLLQLEKTTNRIEQNHRKNNIEFDGIPSSVSDENLVDTVVNIVKDIRKEEVTKSLIIDQFSSRIFQLRLILLVYYD